MLKENAMPKLKFKEIGGLRYGATGADGHMYLIVQSKGHSSWMLRIIEPDNGSVHVESFDSYRLARNVAREFNIRTTGEGETSSVRLRDAIFAAKAREPLEFVISGDHHVATANGCTYLIRSTKSSCRVDLRYPGGLEIRSYSPRDAATAVEMCLQYHRLGREPWAWADHAERLRVAEARAKNRTESSASELNWIDTSADIWARGRGCDYRIDCSLHEERPALAISRRSAVNNSWCRIETFPSVKIAKAVAREFERTECETDEAIPWDVSNKRYIDAKAIVGVIDSSEPARQAASTRLDEDFHCIDQLVVTWRTKARSVIACWDGHGVEPDTFASQINAAAESAISQLGKDGS